MKDITPYAVSIADAVKIVGLGRTSLYAAIAAGTLKTRKSGRRTLVEMAALRQFVDTLPASDSQNAANDKASTPVLAPALNHSNKQERKPS